MRKSLLVACLFLAGAASPVLAANATRPYQNCDRKVDNCGPTGNDMTDQLNSQQLGNSGAGMQGNGMPMQGGSTMPMQGPMQGRGMPMNGSMPMQGSGSGMSR